MPLLMADVSYPPAKAIAGKNLVAFNVYVGGWTPHPWSKDEVDRQKLRYALGTWVYDPNKPGGAQGRDDAHACLAAAKRLGFPGGVRYAVDMEASVDWNYCHEFRNVIAAAGCWTSVYGSASTVFRNYCPGGGFWVADWTGSPFEYNGAHVWATQYADAAQSGTDFDWSELANVDHLWEINPPSPPAPAPAPEQYAALVVPDLPSGVTSRVVHSADGGKTWS